MIRLNDHNFIAYLHTVKRYNYIIDEDNKIWVEINNEEYTQALKDYEVTYKPVLQEIRKLVKKLAKNNKK